MLSQGCLQVEAPVAPCDAPTGKVSVAVGWQLHNAGIWRNLEVAVKTVMFSDRTGSAGAPNGNNKNSPKKRAIMEAAVGGAGGV
jgi:hypothetical protein